MVESRVLAAARLRDGRPGLPRGRSRRELGLRIDDSAGVDASPRRRPDRRQRAERRGRTAGFPRGNARQHRQSHRRLEV